MASASPYKLSAWRGSSATTARQVIAEVTEAGIWRRPIVTQVTPAPEFYRAEEYHQDYFRKNPGAGYCRAIISPKVAKFRKQFAERLKK